jgi:AcrR family transcriptional regulator
MLPVNQSARAKARDVQHWLGAKPASPGTGSREDAHPSLFLRAQLRAATGRAMRSEQPVNIAGGAGATFTSTARRAQFIAAAIETIAEVGYSRASLGRIAGRVGVSKGVISYHFAGKDELVQEVVADIATRGGAFVYAQALTLPTAAGRMRAWIESVLGYLAAHRTEAVAFHEMAAGSRGEPAVSAAVERLVTDVTRRSGRCSLTARPAASSGMISTRRPRRPRLWRSSTRSRPGWRATRTST